jgi:hypothetical protein
MKFFKLPISLVGLTLVSMSFGLFFAFAPAISQEVLKPIAPKFTPDPQIYDGRTGGDLPLVAIAANKANGQCQGFTQQNPNHTLVLQQDFGFLALKATGNRELSLLVKGPDGIYCRNGKDAELTGAWMAGKYEIWIGTTENDRQDYQLIISETNP